MAKTNQYAAIRQQLAGNLQNSDENTETPLLENEDIPTTSSAKNETLKASTKSATLSKAAAGKSDLPEDNFQFTFRVPLSTAEKFETLYNTALADLPFAERRKYHRTDLFKALLDLGLTMPVASLNKK